MKIPTVYNILAVTALGICVVALWLSYYNRQAREASAERARVVELANTVCDKQDWKLSGSGEDLVITCVPRTPIDKPK
jgi:cbb3-type cytochrome oxidase subunit 3